MFPLGRNRIFSSWMATQRWKRRSHIFCDNLLFLFLVRNNNQDQTRRSFFSSCLLVFHFFDPPCGVGPLSVFVKKSVFPFYSSVLFRFFLFFQYENKRPTHFLIDSGDGKAQARTPDVVWCVCLCLAAAVLLLLSVHRFQKRKKKREMMEGRNFSFPHFYTLVRLVMMMAISCTCHGKERQVGQLFHPLSKQMPTFLLTDIWWWPGDDPGLR